MDNSAPWNRRSRRLVLALLLLFVLGLGAYSVAGELAVLHRVLAQDGAEGQAQPAEPCDAPAGARCLPVLGARAAQPQPTASRIGLEMTNCRLGCPTFTAVFSPDGTFTYVGEANVERMGDHTGRVDVAGLRQVMLLADQIAFAELDDTYPSSFLDSPSSYVMVEWPRETKVVLAEGGVEPASFWAIRELLRSLLDRAEWDD